MFLNFFKYNIFLSLEEFTPGPLAHEFFCSKKSKKLWIKSLRDSILFESIANTSLWDKKSLQLLQQTQQFVVHIFEITLKINLNLFLFFYEDHWNLTKTMPSVVAITMFLYGTQCSSPTLPLLSTFFHS